MISLIICILLSINGFLFENNGESEAFITNGATCNNLYEWYSIIDTMSIYGINHFFIILNHTVNKWDSIIYEFDRLEIKYNEEFFEELENLIQYSRSKNIFITIHLFSQCLLENLPGRWENNLWNQKNGGPCPENTGENFLEVNRVKGPPKLWSWQQWNYYYQLLFLNKCLLCFGNYDTVIFSPIWEDEIGGNIVNWFYSVKFHIGFNNLVASVPVSTYSPTVDLGDFIEIENRGVGLEFLIYNKPVVCLGPFAGSSVDEKDFMLYCVKNKIHPSTNLKGECMGKTEGYEFARKLRKWFEKNFH